MQERQLIALNFDGVLTVGRTDWQSYTLVPDPPNEGAITWLQGLLLDTRFDVVIHSCRGNKPEGVAAMMAWLHKHGLERVLIDQISFSSNKPKAKVYLDGHAMQFRGTWPTYDELARFKPWRPKSTPESRPKPTDVNYSEAETEAEMGEIWRSEHRCLTCLHGPVCAIAAAAKQADLMTAVSRCMGYFESFMPDIE